MRGPTDGDYDSEVESSQELEAYETPPRPPGGKALQRLLQVSEGLGPFSCTCATTRLQESVPAGRENSEKAPRYDSIRWRRRSPAPLVAGSF